MCPKLKANIRQTLIKHDSVPMPDILKYAQAGDKLILQKNARIKSDNRSEINALMDGKEWEIVKIWRSSLSLKAINGEVYSFRKEYQKEIVKVFYTIQ